MIRVLDNICCVPGWVEKNARNSDVDFLKKQVCRRDSSNGYLLIRDSKKICCNYSHVPLSRYWKNNCCVPLLKNMVVLLCTVYLYCGLAEYDSVQKRTNGTVVHGICVDLVLLRYVR